MAKKTPRGSPRSSAEAKESLKRHAFNGDPDDPRVQSGFLGSLRPYGGLDEENFHDVMEALRVIAPELSRRKTVDHEVMSALWGICHLGRAWGVYPNGMLRGNGLITPADVTRLEEWIDTISYAVLMLLDGAGVGGAFEGYEPPEGRSPSTRRGPARRKAQATQRKAAMAKSKEKAPKRR